MKIKDIMSGEQAGGQALNALGEIWIADHLQGLVNGQYRPLPPIHLRPFFQHGRDFQRINIERLFNFTVAGHAESREATADDPGLLHGLHNGNILPGHA